VSGAISERARSGFDRFVIEATQRAFGLPQSECTVALSEAAALGEHEVVMLTVSSYRFRILLFIHFERDRATQNHMAALGHTAAPDPMAAPDHTTAAATNHLGERLREERFDDAMMERGNLCCGALNRELSRFFPHLGMSTPCILPGSSMEHLSSLHPSITRHYQAELGPGVALHLTLAICAFADIDFAFGDERAGMPAGGELELF
jgi:hypothetical protein